MYAIFKEDALNLARSVYNEHVQFEQQTLSETDLRARRELRLEQVLQYVCEHSAFYRQHLGEQVLAASAQGQRVGLEKLPFTTKDHLRERGWDMVSAPLGKAWVYYETTGTTGKATPCPRSEIDSIYNNTPLILRYGQILKQHGVGHIVGVMGPTEVHSTGDTFEDVMRSLDFPMVKMWPRSPVIGNQRAATLIEELKITALVCTPAVAISLAKHFLAQGKDPNHTSVRVLFTLGELSTPQLLRNLGSVWGAAVYNCMYASQEASIMAVARPDHQLYTLPLNNVYELLDPDTGTPIEVARHHEEYTGELIITHLYPGQKPLVRYRTGDMMRVRRQLDHTWQLTPIGRVRDRLILNGHNVCAYDIEAALLEHLDGCLDYQIAIERHDDTDRIAVVVANHAPGTLVLDTECAGRHMRDALGVPVRIEVGETDAITGTSAMVSWKAARVHDQRTADDHERLAALNSFANRGA